MSNTLQVAVVLCSDRAHRGERPDATEGPLRTALKSAGHELAFVRVVPDEREAIAAALRECVGRFPIVLTSGGTGLGPRDVTVEATLGVIERLVPGIAEAMRSQSLHSTPMAMLSRGVAGIARGSLIINLPGSPRGAVECLHVVLPVFEHAARLLAGSVTDCADDRREKGTVRHS